MILEGLLKPISEVVNKGLSLIPDPNKRAEIEKELELAAMSLQQGQIDINKEEAKSANLFVAGWRPFVGWTCGFGVAWAFLLQPIAIFILKVSGYTGDTPNVDIANLLALLFGLLGMGTLRSFDKKNGTSK